MSDEINVTGAWVITQVWSKGGVRIDVKTSGVNGIAAADDLYATIKHGMDTYGWTVEQMSAPAKQTTSSPAPAGASAPAAKAVVDTGINTLLVSKMVVTPKPDNKVELQLFETGHKFPDLYHNGTVEQLLAALSLTGLEWLPEHLQKAQEFSVSFFADWRNSEKLNKNGKPYKNIVGYRAADATA